MSADYKMLAERYIATWNSPAEERAARMEDVLAADVFYADPIVAVRGHAELAAYIERTMSRFDGMRFSVPGAVDGHHDQMRFVWHIGPPGAGPAFTGLDVALVEGPRITAVYGFFDRYGFFD
ncbi:nuclear transport factor 2 family protein [Actinomadura terrae]|uniref:nuclear transport factor 2 family protein n=1 Tax=Actinomadura terrae TaxID=604353 RepID=UPI001FA7C339|nr:nuclear transport factor 2 family protein [Actinomadura terrae]